MNRSDFINHVNADMLDEIKTLELKGEAYAGFDDVFTNFKSNAERLGLTKYQIWAVYAFKHIDTIQNSIKRNPQFPTDSSEGLYGRIHDAINYLRLLKGMLYEDVSIEL